MTWSARSVVSVDAAGGVDLAVDAPAESGFEAAVGVVAEFVDFDAVAFVVDVLVVVVGQHEAGAVAPGTAAPVSQCGAPSAAVQFCCEVGGCGGHGGVFPSRRCARRVVVEGCKTTQASDQGL
jgi:hypothetical protein